MDMRFLAVYTKDTGVSRITNDSSTIPDMISSSHTNTCCFASCSFSEIPEGRFVERPFYDFPIDLDNKEYITV